MLLKRFSLQSQFRCVSSTLPSLSRFFNTNTHPNPENDVVQTVFNIITNSTSLEDMQQSLKSSRVFLSNELIDQVLKRVRFSHGNPLQTLYFYHYTGRRKGFFHTAFSFDTMLYILGRSRMFSHAWDLIIEARKKDQSVLDEMRERDLSPDVITYTSIIGGLGLIGQPDKARDMLKEMKEFGCYPDVPAYNAVIRNFCIAKRLGDAYGLMDEMTSKGLSPNATTYNLFFRVFFWSNDLQSSWNLYKRMIVAGCLPNTQSCMFLIRLFKRHEKVEMAMQLWGDMVEKGFGSYTLVSDVLFDLLCDTGKLAESEKCFLEMVEKGQKPSNVSFKRIKVLMELANRHEALQNLTQKMAMFERPLQVHESTRSRARCQV
ncbi:putative tetratricopeptide-like helical domain-containing protein [Lupinus albus]|uniref:Putative tetratricopeptide-like helical domain-containing protein n=1 Tax=Lupinus albus TaxID=3870 RepID=A0A6A4QYS3_LUPAL|nr:putative tetratricopeptide-like helical domain-containing protein [Lupinus albus]